MDDQLGTGERLIHVENAALALAEVVEDLARDMEMISMNMPQTTKRNHELGQAKRAWRLARTIRAAVVEARQQAPGSLSI
jgi:hypothetical protein